MRNQATAGSDANEDACSTSHRLREYDPDGWRAHSRCCDGNGNATVFAGVGHQSTVRVGEFPGVLQIFAGNHAGAARSAYDQAQGRQVPIPCMGVILQSLRSVVYRPAPQRP